MWTHYPVQIKNAHVEGTSLAEHLRIQKLKMQSESTVSHTDPIKKANNSQEKTVCLANYNQP